MLAHAAGSLTLLTVLSTLEGDLLATLLAAQFDKKTAIFKQLDKCKIFGKGSLFTHTAVTITTVRAMC